MFDWTLFDYSNRRKVVQGPKNLRCSTRITFNSDLVQLIMPKNPVEQKFKTTKSKNKLSAINVKFF